MGTPLSGLRVAVTGAGGRLAKLLIPELRAVCREVVGISRHPEPGDMTWKEALHGGLKGVDVLVHTAWSSVPRTSHKPGEPVGIVDTHMCSQLMTNEAAREFKQVIFFSSASVYGPTEGKQVTEHHPQNPRSLYSATKSYVEHLFNVLGLEIGLTPCVLRITNPYGFAYDRHRPQGLIAHALDCLKKGETLDVWGDGCLPKDYLHISDLSRALHSAIEHNLSGIYNVSNGESHTSLEIFDQINALSDKPLRIRFCPAFTWDCGMGVMSHEKLTLATGWQPRESLNEGLRAVFTG
ncbi:MAG: NAD-dependent epimerase/dehydratase family protein [Verrucomicrobiota bacterium]